MYQYHYRTKIVLGQVDIGEKFSIGAINDDAMHRKRRWRPSGKRKAREHAMAGGSQMPPQQGIKGHNKAFSIDSAATFLSRFLFLEKGKNLQKNTTRSKQSETPDTYEWEQYLVLAKPFVKIFFLEFMSKSFKSLRGQTFHDDIPKAPWFLSHYTYKYHLPFFNLES